MLHHKKDTAPLDEPSYTTTMANINLIMQSKQFDVAKQSVKKMYTTTTQTTPVIHPIKVASKQIKTTKRTNVQLKKIGLKSKSKANVSSNVNSTKIEPLHIAIPKSIQDELTKLKNYDVFKSFNEKSQMAQISKPANKTSQSLNGVNVNDNSESFSTLREHRMRAVNAYNERKIFTIYGNFSRLRRSLIQRGWVEKIRSGYLRKLHKLSQHSLLSQCRHGNDYEKVSISRLVQNYPSYFIWHPRLFRSNDECMLPYKSRIRREWQVDFSSKIGLMGCAERAHWHTIDQISEVLCPRFHQLESSKWNEQFLNDYRLTACLSLLNFIATEEFNYTMYDENGKIPLSDIHFALKIVKDAMTQKKEAHSDIDNPMENNEVDDLHWNTFISNSRLIIHKSETFSAQYKDFILILGNVICTIEKAKKIWPTIEMDGYFNMWILKPGFQCRGNGIVIYPDYQQIIDFVAVRPSSKYVVQKYIERPLLIYNTKFDIRIYLLVTIASDNVSVWMYKNCYLRFSSREFSLSDTDRSIHLTNHSVQKRYKNTKQRNPKLPFQNMWTLEQFKNYLKQTNDEEAWDTIIYPGMKRSVLAIVLASLEGTDITPNVFEIYGCDFMLDEKFNPMLLEINSNPDMSHSTRVTAYICPAALEDVIKVVLDRKKNPAAPTGNFELIYKANCQKLSTSNFKNLEVMGSPMKIYQLLPKSQLRKSTKLKQKKNKN